MLRTNRFVTRQCPARPSTHTGSGNRRSNESVHRKACQRTRSRGVTLVAPGRAISDPTVAAEINADLARPKRGGDAALFRRCGGHLARAPLPPSRVAFEKEGLAEDRRYSRRLERFSDQKGRLRTLASQEAFRI